MFAKETEALVISSPSRTFNSDHKIRAKAHVATNFADNLVELVSFKFFAELDMLHQSLRPRIA